MNGQARAVLAALMVLVLDLLHWLLPALAAQPMARLSAADQERRAFAAACTISRPDAPVTAPHLLMA
ncbi:hypothetical protein AB0I84_44360, partial [Streptomyces spectabilis]|uniref:hypothetical protein n=1 Tax=Streptomyces spectabilis TaxID=68270 RepID=UPI0033D70EB1